MGLLALGIEFLGPGRGNIESVRSRDDVAGYAHVINLAHPGAVEAVVLEVLTEIHPPLGPVVAAVHERGPGGVAGRALAVGPLEDHRLGGELVEIGGPADRVSITAEHAGLEVIGDEKEDVLDFRICLGRQAQNEKGKVANGGHGCSTGDWGPCFPGEGCSNSENHSNT